MKPQASTFALSVVALSLGSASAAERPGVEHNVAKFLQSLEGGQTLDSMSPTDARAALAGAQAASNVALPAAEVSEKTIRVNDSDLKLTIVRPAFQPRQKYHFGIYADVSDIETLAPVVRRPQAKSPMVPS